MHKIYVAWLADNLHLRYSFKWPDQALNSDINNIASFESSFLRFCLEEDIYGKLLS